MWGRGPINRQAFVVRSTPAERRGLAILLVLSLLYIGWRNYVYQFPQAASNLRTCDLLGALEQIPVQNLSGNLSKSSTAPIVVANLDSSAWNALGLSPKQSAVAVRFAHAVGGIADHETLSRLRVLPNGWLDMHASRLVFPARDPRPTPAFEQASGAGRPGFKSQKNSIPDSKPALKPDLNTADSLTLLEVFGIGPWVAARILEAQRERGGIASEQDFAQALRGWDSLATALAPRVTWNAATVLCRCPDTLSVEQWRALPGITYARAQTLQNYRANHPGPVGNIYGCLALDSASVERILPYLCCRETTHPHP